MKVWITRYALSDGIIEAEMNAASKDKPGRVCCVLTRAWGVSPVGSHVYAAKSDRHYSKEAAAITARLMRDMRVASLKKQIAKLEAMTF